MKQPNIEEEIDSNRPLELTTVLFDLDGTLLDSKEMLVDAAYRTAKEFKLKSLTQQKIAQHFGMGFSKYLSTFGAEKERLDAFFTNEKATSYHTNLFFSNVKAGLRKLQEQDVLLGIVTNQQREFVMEVLETHQLDHIFDCIVTKDEVFREKPDAEPILLAIEQLNVDPKHVLMVGDTEYDQLSAKQAAVSFAQINFYETGRSLDTAFYFSEFNQLVNFILKHKKRGSKTWLKIQK